MAPAATAPDNRATRPIFSRPTEAVPWEGNRPTNRARRVLQMRAATRVTNGQVLFRARRERTAGTADGSPVRSTPQTPGRRALPQDAREGSARRRNESFRSTLLPTAGERPQARAAPGAACRVPRADAVSIPRLLCA